MAERLPCYDAHGLRVASPLPLSLPAAAGPPEVTVRVGPRRAIPWRRPSAAVVAELIGPEGLPRYSFTRRADGGVAARIYNLADFGISADRHHIVARPGVGTDEGVVAILLAGSISAFLLAERGACVLHASAVELAPGRAVAFAGFSARGKTTSAALLCAARRPLITDDVLAVDLEGPEPACVPGGHELRLRPQQAALADLLGPDTARRRTADERLAVTVPAPVSRRPALAAVVVPVPSRDDRRVRLERLDLAAATTELIAAPRIEGWRRAADTRRVFDHAVDLATRVPVIRAAIPWGPPFPAGIATELADALEDALSAPAAGAA